MSNQTTQPSVVEPEEIQTMPDWKYWGNPDICCICNKDETPDAPLFVCSTMHCAVTVHKSCYGIRAGVSARNWKCDRCRVDSAREEVVCFFCPKRDGALKRLPGTSYWSHVVCNEWILNMHESKGLCDENGNYAEVLNQLEYKTRWERECSQCRTDFGCTYPCDSAGCTKAIHAACANVYIENLETYPDPDISNPYFVYCKKHSCLSKEGPWITPWAEWLQLKYSILRRDALRGSARPMEQNLAEQKNLADYRKEKAVNTVRIEQEICRKEAEKRWIEGNIFRIRNEQNNLTLKFAEEKKCQEQLAAQKKQLTEDLMKIVNCFQIEEINITQENVVARLCGMSRSADVKIKPEYESIFIGAYTRAQQQDALPGNDVMSVLNPPNGKGKRKRGFDECANFGFCEICKSFEGGSSTSEAGSSSKKRRGADVSKSLLQCMQCTKRFHMGCLDPPMEVRPPRGYAWRCEQCDSSTEKSEEEEVVLQENGRPKRRRVAARRFTF